MRKVLKVSEFIAPSSPAPGQAGNLCSITPKRWSVNLSSHSPDDGELIP